MEKQKITVDTLEINANEEKQLLRENVKDLQRQLNSAQIRIKELLELVDNKNIL
jgi:ABC-type Zn2+ transport system substrate-binding protein/surface adhesin